MSVSKTHKDPEQANHRDSADWWWPGAGGGKTGSDIMGTGSPSGVMGMFQN